jgi:hypothetical protein
LLLPSNQGEEAEGNSIDESPILATLAHNRTRNVKAGCFSTNFKIVGPLKKPSEAVFHPMYSFASPLALRRWRIWLMLGVAEAIG